MHNSAKKKKPILIYKPNLMKNKISTFLSNKPFRNFWLACFLCLGSVTGAIANIGVTLTSPNTMYTPGQANTFTFNITTTSGGAEWIDRFQFVFPAAITVSSG